MTTSAPTQKAGPPRGFPACCSSIRMSVEPRGLEPLTPALQRPDIGYPFDHDALACTPAAD